jgi:Galactose-3-O-sulfotransferase
MLDIAKKNLAEHFAAVGISEEFDRSVILMKRILAWRNPFYLKQNVGLHRPRKEDIPPETLRVIEAHNALDIELYRYAKELFRKQVYLQGNSFDLEAQIFRKLNATYRRLHLFMSSRIDNLKKAIPLSAYLDL